MLLKCTGGAKAAITVPPGSSVCSCRPVCAIRGACSGLRDGLSCMPICKVPDETFILLCMGWILTGITGREGRAAAAAAMVLLISPGMSGGMIMIPMWAWIPLMSTLCIGSAAAPVQATLSMFSMVPGGSWTAWPVLLVGACP